MGLALRSGDGSRSERSRLWKRVSAWAGQGLARQLSNSVGHKTEAASMALPGLWPSCLALSPSLLHKEQGLEPFYEQTSFLTQSRSVPSGRLLGSPGMLPLKIPGPLFLLA